MNLKLFPIAGSFLSCLLGISEATAKPAVVQLEDLRITCAGPAEYTQVWNAEDLRQITEDMLANNSPNLKYRQCADIELPAEGFLPIGYYPEVPFDAQGFKGEYLGQGFRISGHRPPAGFAGDFGLFRRLDGARISNLRIIGSQYFGPAAVAGALAGTINDGTILEGITISEAAIG